MRKDGTYGKHSDERPPGNSYCKWVNPEVMGA